MARPCSICTDDRLDEIDEAIVSGRSLRDVAATFALTKDSIKRHKDAHVSPSLVRLGERLQTQESRDALDRPAERLVGRMETLYSRIEAVLGRAEESGKDATFLAGSKELRATAELLARLTGILDDRPQQVVNLIGSPDWLKVRQAILEALEPHPDALGDVVGRLKALEAG